MQLALVEQADARLQPSLRRDLARTVRPWALLALGALAYAVYTAVDALPSLLAAGARWPQLVAASGVALVDEGPQVPRLVTKCVEDGATTYSDGGCAPGAHVDVIGIASSPRAPDALSDAARQQVCTELVSQVRRIALKASAVPSPGEHAWLEARFHEARHEQSRLGC